MYRERLEGMEKESRLKALLHRSPPAHAAAAAAAAAAAVGGHSHSHDSAIDSDLQEWETENVDLDLNGLGSTEDLGIDLCGGRDDLGGGGEGGERPIYISSIGKGSLLDGKLK